MSRAAKVVWDQTDKVKVATAVKTFLASGQEISISIFNGLIKETLPKEKHRTIASWTAVPWLNELVGAIPNPGLVAKRRSSNKDLPADVMDHPLSSLKITPHVRACLQASGMNTVRDLVTKRDEEILAIRQLGHKALSIINRALIAKDRSLKMGMAMEQKSVEVKSSTETKPEVGGMMSTEELAEILVYPMVPAIKDLAAKVVQRGVGIFQAELTRIMVMHTSPSLEPGKEEHGQSGYRVESHKVPKKKIVVVGMENKEAARLESEFGSICTLRVYNHTKSLDTLRNVLPTADVVLIPTDYTNHSASEVVKARFLGEPIRFTGGMSTVRGKMREVLGIQ